MTVFQCATRICSGPDALTVLKTFHANRVFIITDSYFSQSGKALEIGRLAPEAEVRVFDRVVPDPPASLAAEGAAICTAFQPDLLIALGGGSAIDCAKGIRAAYAGQLTFIAIPTTSGSGSEMTSYAILTHDGLKHPLVDDSLRPDVAILDDGLLQSLPKSLIADAGMDLLAHCIEALAATGRNSFTEALASYGVQTVLHDLGASFRGDRNVRLRIHEAASMAGVAFEHAGLGLCHAVAHVLGGAFHIPHGRLCAMLLPHVMNYNAPGTLESYADLARRCGIQGATDRLAMRNLLTEFQRLRKELHLPENLAQAGVTKAQWGAQVDHLPKAVLEDPCCQTNPVIVTEEGVREILKAVAP